MKESRKIGFSLLAVGGALISLGALEPLKLWPSVPSMVYYSLVSVGVLVILLGFLSMASSIRFSSLFNTEYEPRRAKRRELKTIWRFAKRALPECPSWSDTKRHFNRASEGFLVVERIRETRWFTTSRIVGFVTIVPLTDEGVSELKKGHPIQEVFFAPSFKSTNAKGLYIGSIAARGARAKGEALGYMRATIENLTQNGLRMVFTRPITKDGLRLVHRADFEPVLPNVDETELGHVYWRKF